MKKKYKVGVIGRTGKGNYGHGLDYVWKSVPEVEVLAVADDNKGGLVKAREKTGAKRSYSDYRKMFEQEELDIVSISQRWIDKHHEMAMTAAEHGCHVYMEKPFCPTLQEADEIVTAFESKHLKLAIAHTTRYSPTISIAKQMLDAGEIGQLLEMRGRGKEDRRGGGEDLWVLGSHVLDLMRYFNGDVASCEAQVSNKGLPATSKEIVSGAEGIGPLTGDGLYANFEFQNGVPGYFASYRNQAGSPTRFGLTLYGSKGVIRLKTGYNNQASILRESSWFPDTEVVKWENITLDGAKGKYEVPVVHSKGGNQTAVYDLIRAIEQDDQPISNMYDAREATEMIVSVFESHRQQSRVEFPLENRQNPLTMLK